MTDLLKRLESWGLPSSPGSDPARILCREAAAEIQRLSTALENARKDALEEAAKRIETEFPPTVPNESADGTYYVGQMYPSAFIIAAIRSLTPPTEKAT